MFGWLGRNQNNNNGKKRGQNNNNVLLTSERYAGEDPQQQQYQDEAAEPTASAELAMEHPEEVENDGSHQEEEEEEREEDHDFSDWILNIPIRSATHNYEFGIHLAASLGYTQLVLDYLRWNINWMDARNRHGWTPLMYAAQGGNYEVCKLLMRWGAKTGLRNWNGKTAMELAEDWGHNPNLREPLPDLPEAEEEAEPEEEQQAEEEQQPQMLG